MNVPADGTNPNKRHNLVYITNLLFKTERWAAEFTRHSPAVIPNEPAELPAYVF
jgi:hypothetical protein